MFFTFLCFLLMIFLFKMAPKHTTEVQSIVPKNKKAVLYESVTEFVCFSRNVIGCLNINESTVYIK